MKRFHPYFVCVGSLMLTFFIYSAGLHGGFLFDDVANIQDNAYLKVAHLDAQSLWQAAQSSSAGMLKRPISMLTFALDYYFSGMDAYSFKRTNLFIHLLNGIAIFFLSRLLLDLYRQLHRPLMPERTSVWISVAISSLWLLHPFNLTGGLYVVQRMASLSALFIFCGLILYLYGRKCLLEQKTGGIPIILAAIFVFTPLAVLSKENGFLLPIFMLAIELTVLQWQAPDACSRRVLQAVFAFFVLLPIALALGYVLFHPEAITVGYRIRDFSLMDRLMTEARVLWFYMYMTLLPNIAAMGFYHDDMEVSRSLFSPATTIFAIAGILVLLGAAVWWRKKYPLFSFGILFFLIGHSMESSVIALELVHEHRNYLPMFGLLLPVVYYVLSPMIHPSSLRLRSVAAPVVIALFAVLTFMRAGQWSDPFGMMQVEVMHHPQSARANSDLAFQYAYLPAKSQIDAEENYRNAIFYFSQAADFSDRDTAGFFGIIAVNSERGLPTDPSWVDELEKRLEKFPSMPSSVNSLMALEKCLAAGHCTHSPQIMERLLRAALRNSTLTGPRRSAVSFALCDFLLVIMRQPEQAASAAYQAVESAPDDVTQRFTLIAFLANMGKLDAAEAELSKARLKDSQGVYTSTLTKLEQQLAELRAPQRGA